MKTSRILLLLLLVPFLAFSQETAELISEGDSAYLSFKNKLALEKYQAVLDQDPEHFEALWKATRTMADLAKQTGGDKEKQMYLRADTLARRCVALHPDSAESHFVVALAVGRLALFEGGKKKIELSKEVEQEAKKALELNPSHDGAAHILGRWNYTLSTLNWFMRTAAKVVYGGVPEGASLENSERFFQKAIEHAPDKPSHRLEYARTLIEMEKYTEAQEQLKMCIELPNNSWEDEGRKKEAGEMLEDIEGK